MPKPLIPAAIGIVYDNVDQIRILWVKRKDFPIWVLPGGGIEQDETAEESVLREIEEESGIQAEILYKGAYFFQNGKWTADTHVFVCVAKGGTLRETSEAASAHFFPVNQLPIPRLPTHEIWLNKVRKGEGKLLKEPVPGATVKDLIPFLFRHPVISIRFLLSQLL